METIQLITPCGEKILQAPLIEREMEELQELLILRTNLEKEGKILFMSQAKRVAGLTYQLHNFGDDTKQLNTQQTNI